MNLEIRTAQPGDAPSVQAIYAAVVLDSAISFEEVPPTVEEMRQRIATTLATFPYLVALHDGQVVGYAYAGAHHARAAYRWSVDVTVYIAENQRRNGVGRQLYERLLPLLRKLGYRSAYAAIALPNPGSVGLHERLGFRPVGTFPQVGFKLGSWHDVGYWHCELAEHDANPPSPTPFTDLPQGDS